MKSLWTIISIVAVANLLGLAGFIGWLKSTDRLDTDRLRETREMYTKTIAQQRTEAEEAKRQAEAEAAQREQDAKSARPPLTASEQLAVRLGASEIDEQRIAAMRAEAASLKAELDRQIADLETRRKIVEAAEKQFNAQIAAHNALVEDAQFKKTLGVLESLKPTDAKAAMMEIIAQDATSAATAFANLATDPSSNQPAELSPAKAQTATTTRLHGKTLVAAYLNQMEDRSRTRVITEILKADPVLAGELLEMLRTQGQFAPTAQASSP